MVPPDPTPEIPEPPERPGGRDPRDARGDAPRDDAPSAEAAPDAPTRRSLLPDDHWSRSRTERNAAEIEYLRSKSRVPGMDGEIAERNHYCMECGGVLPLRYDRFRPASREAQETCPHCGATLDANVRAMFNWVEIDQVHSSDAAAVLPLALGLLAVVLVLVALAFVAFG